MTSPRDLHSDARPKPSPASFRLIVVGAGPAGLACAVEAARSGVEVLLVDAGSRPGGQFWRHGGPASASARGEGHHDWSTFVRLQGHLEELTASGRVRYLPRTHVWMAERTGTGFRIHTIPSADAASPAPGTSRAYDATDLALCAGAYDRQLPIPGWDLPGVMAAGGIQAFIKTNGFAPGHRAVLGGTGPFLLPVAAALAHAGARVAAVCEANDPRRWLPHWHRALQAPDKLAEGAGYAAALLRHRIPYRPRTRVTRALGHDHLEAIELARVDFRGAIVPGSKRTIACDLLGLGWGFTPLLELPLSLGVETRVDVDGSLVVVVDDAGRTSVPGLWAAGETTGVGGAPLAVAEGLNVAGSIARGHEPDPGAAGRFPGPTGRDPAAAGRHTGPAGRDTGPAGPTPAPLPGLPSEGGGTSALGSGTESTRALRRRIARMRSFAVGMHEAYPVPEAWEEPVTDATVVCRCEEVTAGQISGAADLGAGDVRSAKSVTRAGMGWCQGRECAFAVACMTSDDPRRPDADALRAGNRRPLSAPVPLSALANLEAPGSEGGAPEVLVPDGGPVSGVLDQTTDQPSDQATEQSSDQIPEQPSPSEQKELP